MSLIAVCSRSAPKSTRVRTSSTANVACTAKESMFRSITSDSFRRLANGECTKNSSSSAARSSARTTIAPNLTAWFVGDRLEIPKSCAWCQVLHLVSLRSQKPILSLPQLYGSCTEPPSPCAPDTFRFTRIGSEIITEQPVRLLVRTRVLVLDIQVQRAVGVVFQSESLMSCSLVLAKFNNANSTQECKSLSAPKVGHANKRVSPNM